MLTRRQLLYRASSSLGSVALTSLLHGKGELDAKPPHHHAKAKACIFLTMEGGPSHIDTFDPKPKLDAMHGKEFVRQSKFASMMESGQRYYVKTPFQFRQTGQAGLPMCEHFQHLAKVADELCLFRGGVAESPNHPTALYHLNTGNKFIGDPSIGAWAGYGLGTPNQNLPAFVVLPDQAFPQGGSANWGNGFLPAHYQGTPLRSRGAPVLDMQPPPGTTLAAQRESLELLSQLNRSHAAEHPHHRELEARIESYELAFRMQSEMPGVVDFDKESAEVRQLYGIWQKNTEAMGRRSLLAPRLLDRGVRFVQVYASGWDSHDYLDTAHTARIRGVDQPIAALIQDLRRLGLLESTLIVWGGEFGRSPDNGYRRGSTTWGRDHNPKAMTFWFAGGGTRKGAIVGATDELGAEAVEEVHPLRDVHVTLLHLLGLDDARLTYFHAGRYRQLSQFGGQVIRPLLA